MVRHRDECGGRRLPGKLTGGGEHAGVINSAAVAALNNIDPMTYLGLDHPDFLILSSVIRRADEIGMERRKAELEALAKAVRI